MTTIAPEQINLLTLPSVPLDCRKDLPEYPGIYFAIDNAGTVQYIGRSSNIRQRWLQHHRYNQLEALGSVAVAWLQVSDNLLLPSIEAALIEYFQPLLNNQVTSGTKSQLNIKVNAELYQKYKAKLKDLGTSITEDIENHMRQYLGGKVAHDYTADLVRMVQDIEILKKQIVLLKQTTKSI